MTGMSNVTKLAGEPSGQEFLVFTLGDEEYGIDILKVQEIRGYDQVTRIANTPAFIKGVTNLRGVIVPIVDLRVKFSQGDCAEPGSAGGWDCGGWRFGCAVADNGSNPSGTGVCGHAVDGIFDGIGCAG